MAQDVISKLNSEKVLQFIYPVLAGCCIFLAFEGYNIFPILFLLPFFLNGMRRLPIRKKMTAYWIMATVTNLGGFGWIQHVAIDFGGMPFLAALGVLLLFSLFNNLNFVLWAYLERFFGEKSNPFIIAAFFCFAEQVNPQVFPWYFGASLDSVLVLYQTADIWGIIGLSFVAITVIHIPYWLWQNRQQLFSERKVLFAGQFLFLAVILGYGSWALERYNNNEAPGKKAVGLSLIQTNTAMEKFYGESQSVDERLKEFYNIIHLSQKAIESHPGKTDLVVWPEGGVHFPIMSYERILNPIADLAKRNGVGVAAGSVELGEKKESGRREYYNTQIVLDTEGKVESKYRKIVLLAFGEYIPFLETFPFLEQWLPETISHFTHGEEKPVFKLKENINWLPLICYEDIIAGFIDGFDHEKADFFVNVTNDGWFGKTDASHLHKQMARPRAVEYRKPLVRVLNTGSSQILDSAGRTISKNTGLYVQDTINATLYLPEQPARTVYSMIGNTPIYILILIIFGLWVREKFFKVTE